MNSAPNLSGPQCGAWVPDCFRCIPHDHTCRRE